MKSRIAVKDRRDDKLSANQRKNLRDPRREDLPVRRSSVNNTQRSTCLSEEYALSRPVTSGEPATIVGLNGCVIVILLSALVIENHQKTHCQCARFTSNSGGCTAYCSHCA
jgi:hypothetical protein